MRQRSLARRTSSASVVASAGRLASQYFAGSAAPSGHWQSSQASGSAARWARRRPMLAGRTRSARKRALMGPREPSRQATSRTFFNPRGQGQAAQRIRRPAVAGLRRPPGAAPGGALGEHVLPVGALRGLDLDDVAQLALLEGGTEGGDLAVAGIGDDGRWRESPGAQLVEHLQRQAPLLAVTLALRQVRLGAARRIAIPSVRQEEPPGERAAGRLGRG